MCLCVCCVDVPSAPVIDLVVPYPSTAMMEFDEPDSDGGVPVLKYKAVWRIKGQESSVNKVYNVEEGKCLHTVLHMK